MLKPKKSGSQAVMPICIMILLALAFSPSTAKAARKVILNSWDGVEYQAIAQLLQSNKLTYIAGIGPLHSLTDNTQCFSNLPARCDCMQTSTIPQHATMLTGTLADKHGITSNNCSHQIPPGLTIYNKLYPSIKTAHIATKSLALGKQIYGNDINAIHIFTAEDSMTIPEATEKAINLITQWRDKDFFIFLHFREPDSTGHASGYPSAQYEKAIVQNDIQLGRIIRHLKATGIYGKTAIYVLSDHGFGKPRPNNHTGTPHTFIASTDPAVNDTKMADIATFILRNYAPARLAEAKNNIKRQKNPKKEDR